MDLEIPTVTLSAPSPRKSSTILALPNDILLLIISFIHVREILALRQVRHFLHAYAAGDAF